MSYCTQCAELEVELRTAARENSNEVTALRARLEKAEELLRGLSMAPCEFANNPPCYACGPCAARAFLAARPVPGEPKPG